MSANLADPVQPEVLLRDTSAIRDAAAPPSTRERSFCNHAGCSGSISWIMNLAADLWSNQLTRAHTALQRLLVRM
jgi:hypothetical protein